jgi:hypothetical protein
MKMVKMTTASGGEIQCHPSQVESMQNMGWKVDNEKPTKKSESKTEKEDK